jgi:hypothetical protein
VISFLLQIITRDFEGGLMPYRIEEVDSIFEVHVSNPTSRQELLQAIEELAGKDPRKERRDLWYFPKEAFVSLAEFSEIVRAVQSLCSPDMVGNKTALVVSGELQRAQLPFEIGVFTIREDALRWLKDAPGVA